MLLPHLSVLLVTNLHWWLQKDKIYICINVDSFRNLTCKSALTDLFLLFHIVQMYAQTHLMVIKMQKGKCAPVANNKIYYASLGTLFGIFFFSLFISRCVPYGITVFKSVAKIKKGWKMNNNDINKDVCMYKWNQLV